MFPAWFILSSLYITGVGFYMIDCAFDSDLYVLGDKNVHLAKSFVSLIRQHLLLDDLA